MKMLSEILKTLTVRACGTFTLFIKELICCKHIHIALLATIVFSFSFISLSSARIYAEPLQMQSPATISTDTTICPPALEAISASASGTLLQDSSSYKISHQPLKPVSLPLNNTTDSNPQQDEEKTGIWTKIKDYFEDPDWLLIGLIIAAVVVVVLTIIVLTRRQDIPEKQDQLSEQHPPAGMQQPTGSQQPMGKPQMPGGQQLSACPACGSQNPPDRKFCGSCGTNLAATPQQSTPPVQQMVSCPSCGTPNPQDRKFCGNCGTNLLAKAQKPTAAETPRETVCRQCGTPNPPGRKFCGNCGNSLLGGAQQQQQTSQPPQDVICISCGTLNPPGRKFCGNCGEALMAAGTYQQYSTGQSFSCPICGATIQTGMNPCPNCRTWLDWG
jgi:predicted nucleic acid-binding Zn ribbon protein